MKQFFDAGHVEAFTTADLTSLIGTYVRISTEASEWYKENVPNGGDWEGGAGTCINAGIQSRNNVDVLWVMFDWGMGWSWARSQKTVISTCDEHRDHPTRWNHDTAQHEDAEIPGAAECARTLAVQGISGKVKEVGEKEGAQKDD